MTMSPAIITLTTDFGLHDPYVAMMKGVVLGRAPQARLVDITHAIPAWQPEIAGFWLRYCVRWFPAGTVHVAVVDPGVGSERRLLAVELDDQLALAPDNGLLGPLLARNPRARVRHIDTGALTQVLPANPSATFHGRDILAPLAAEIAAARLSADALGPEIDNYHPGALAEAIVGDRHVRGQVVLVDHYGNLVTNIETVDLPTLGGVEVHIGRRHIAWGRTYSEVRPGELLALSNAHGLLEIAASRASAAEALHATPGAVVEVRWPSQSAAR